MPPDERSPAHPSKRFTCAVVAPAPTLTAALRPRDEPATTADTLGGNLPVAAQLVCTNEPPGRQWLRCAGHDALPEQGVGTF